jgi:hypothetical protein
MKRANLSRPAVREFPDCPDLPIGVREKRDAPEDLTLWGAVYSLLRRPRDPNNRHSHGGDSTPVDDVFGASD